MIDFATIAAGATEATESELPMSARKGVDSNPFTELVAKAAEDGKRYDLPGRFSLTSFEGRKAACEPCTVISKLPKKSPSGTPCRAVTRGSSAGCPPMSFPGDRQSPEPDG